MRKILLLLLMTFFWGNSQNLLLENFDALGDPIALPTGWTVTNQSSPVGTIGWFRGGGGTTFGGFNGGQTGYIGANFNNTAGVGVISNWLMSPVVNLQNGDVITFYTRTADLSQWADNLEMRLSVAGATSTDPSGTTGVGSYTTLAVTVNAVFPTASGYPQVWTQFTYTVSGLAVPTDCRVAFRYTVPTSAGPSGNNSNFIGIDAFSIDRTLSTDDFFATNFSLSPNPVSNDFTIQSKNQLITAVQVTDINGRIVKNNSFETVANVTVDTSDLKSGIYFVSVQTDSSTGTTKIIKN